MATITYTTATSSRTKAEQCSHCGAYYAYTLRRTGGHARHEGVISLFASRRKAQAHAQAAARNELRRELRRGSDPIRCPKCRRFARKHWKALRRKKYHTLRLVAAFLLLVGLCFAGFYLALPAPFQAPAGPLALLALVPALACLFLGSLLLLLQRLWTNAYDPDRSDRKHRTGQRLPDDWADADAYAPDNDT